MNLRASSYEIRKFYSIIEKICKELKIRKYIREDENVSLEDNNKFIKYDEETSILSLKDIKEKIGKDEYKRYEIFGVYNPISIGLKEIKQIDNNLDNFEKYLHDIQSMDVYYATPRVYKVKGKLIGIYAISSNILSVVPTSLYVVLNQIQEIEEWYVMLKEGTTIRYDDFINNINIKEYYDANHFIVILNDKEINELIKKFFIKI